MQDRNFPHLTRWLSLPGGVKNQLAIGVPSVKAMGMNAKALEVMAEWYVPYQTFPKTIPIDVMRREVGRVENPIHVFLFFLDQYDIQIQYIYSKFVYTLKIHMLVAGSHLGSELQGSHWQGSEPGGLSHGCLWSQEALLSWYPPIPCPYSIIGYLPCNYWMKAC